MARPPSSPRPILCAVLDGVALGPEPRARAAALFAAGVDWIQLRDRTLDGAPLLALARELVAARDAARRAAQEAQRTAGCCAAPHASPTAGCCACVIVNKRSDVALAAGADGVHLGMDAVDPRSAAALFQAARAGGVLLGASCHSLAEIDSAAREQLPLAYVHLAPIWSPRSKPAERPELGPAALARASARAAVAGIRVLAQGGLDAVRAAEAMAAGAAGVAVTGILSQARDPAEGARGLRRALDQQAACESETGSERTVARPLDLLDGRPPR